MEEIRNQIGVIIGRFQVHELHSEHKNLIKSVLNKHEKVIVFLGTTSAVGTRRNPLDFITRKLMLEKEFPQGISAILPLPDQKSDHVWSNQLDSKIVEIFPMDKATLYGSRDSFIPYYHGKHDTCELEPESYVSATDIRDAISKKLNSSADFRAGVIYAVYNQYPIVHPTIDVVIVKEETNEILLGRKANESNWRFVGGFVDTTDKDMEATCKREVLEETGLEVTTLKPITTLNIDDWRYRKDQERSIMTSLYEAKYVFGSPTPMDDIAELKWFKNDDYVETILVEGHKRLWQAWYTGRE